MFETIFCILSWIAIVDLFVIAGLEWSVMRNLQMALVYALSAWVVFFGNVVIAGLVAGDYFVGLSAGALFLLSCFAARFLFVSNSNRQGAAA